MADLKISQLTGATTPLAGTEIVPIVQSSTTKKVAVSELVKAAGQASSGTGTPAANVVHTFQQSASLSTAIRVVNRNSTQAWHVAVDAAAVDDGLLAIINPALGQVVATVNTNGNVTLSTGNLVIGTAGKGIDFSADPSSAGMTSELLDDYEEGTWTPTFAYSVSNGDLNYTAGLRNGAYTRVGRLVTVNFYVLFNETTASGNLTLTNLPFAAANLTNIIAGGGMYVDNMTGFTGAPTWQINQNGGTVMSFWDSAAGTAVALSNTNTAAANNVIRVVAQYFTE